MKIALVSGEFPPQIGGIADYTALLGRALQERDVEIAVITSTKAYAAKQPFPVHAVLSHWGWSTWAKLYVTLQQEVPDIVHIQYQTAAYAMHPGICLLPIWLRHRGYRVVTTFHDLREPYLFPKAGRLRYWLTTTLARSSDEVVAITPEDMTRLQAWLGSVASKRLHSIPIGSNIIPPANHPKREEELAFRARFRIAPNDRLLGYFGLLNQSKGLEILLGALLRLRESAPGIRLLVIGGDTGSSDASNEQTRQGFLAALAARGLTDVVTLTGHLEPVEVSLALASIDVCLLPYRDGVSLRRGSLMAALAHGCAIVTTEPTTPTTTAHPERVKGFPALEDGYHALLVPREDPLSLAAAAQRLLHESELRVKLSARAEELADAFTWDKIASAHIDLYNTLIGSNHLNPVAA